MLAEAVADSSLNALWPALGAIGVALVGLVGNMLIRRKGTDDEEDTNVITALASALAAETEARKAAEQRAMECEAREQARRRR